MVQRNADAIGLLEDLMADLESKLDVGESWTLVLRPVHGSTCSANATSFAPTAPDGDPLAPERGAGDTEPQHAQATTPREKTAATAAIDGDVRVIPFCVPLPSPGAAAAGGPAEGVVGTITLRGPSAVVWFGWGAVEAVGADGGGAGAVADDGLAAGNGAWRRSASSLIQKESGARGKCLGRVEIQPKRWCLASCFVAQMKQQTRTSQQPYEFAQALAQW